MIDLHPASNPKVRMNGVCPYFTMYPLSFPYRRLAEQGPATRVLDPFCGRGTTNFAARLRGLESVGIDSNPVAAAVAAAKLTATTAEAVATACENALRQVHRGAVPEGEFWERCYHKDTLAEIARLRSYFLYRERLTHAEKVLRAIVLGLLHGPKAKRVPTYLSNQMPRTYATKPASAVAYWRRTRDRAPKVDVRAAVRRRAEYLLKDAPPSSRGRIRLGDSRKASAFADLGQFDLIVTSPPYLGMRTYWPDQWLRNWFMGGSSSIEYAPSTQITSQDRETFVADLASVWKHTAAVSRPRARLVIRFGALPSCKADPATLIRSTLSKADAGWEISTIRRAGAASKGHRQAEQFRQEASEPIEEIDVYCRLEP
jgi:hypothetical protein